MVTAAPKVADVAAEAGAARTSPVAATTVGTTASKMASNKVARTVRSDAVVVAGKGHENYQEINGERAHFDDRETVRELCREILSKQTTGRWPRRTE